MDEKTGYNEMVSLIAGIEKDGQGRQQVYTIDISGMLTEAKAGEKPDFRKAAHIASEIEALQQEMEKRAHQGYGGLQMPKRAYEAVEERGQMPQGEGAPNQIKTAGIGIEKEYEEVKTAISEMERRTISQSMEAYQEVEDVEKKVAEELNVVIGRIGGGIGKARIGAGEREEETEEMVLPTLPISDQIPELEKIAEGLDTNSFDQEQLGIIKSELSALKRLASAENPAGENGLERSMRMLRDSRMNYVLALLKGV